MMSSWSDPRLGPGSELHQESCPLSSMSSSSEVSSACASPALVRLTGRGKHSQIGFKLDHCDTLFPFASQLGWSLFLLIYRSFSFCIFFSYPFEHFEDGSFMHYVLTFLRVSFSFPFFLFDSQACFSYGWCCPCRTFELYFPSRLLPCFPLAACFP